MDYDDDGWQEYKDDLAMGRIYEDGTQREPPEPDYNCWECNDSGRVVAFDDTSPPDGREDDCPQCRPTPEQAARREAEHAAREAEYARAVAAGEIQPLNYDDPPF